MNEPTIVCPKCRTEIKLTESLAAPIIEATREKFRQHLQSETAKLEDREAAVLREKQEIAKTKAELDEQIEHRIAAERTKIAIEEKKRAQLLLGDDLKQREAENASLKEALSARDEKLKEAQLAQAQVLRKERELDDERRELELTVEKRVGAMLSTERERGKKEAEESSQLRIREQDERIASMHRTIEELKKKAEQGSQQLQGEVFELQLEEMIRQHFPSDTVEPVGKGQLGADLIQKVVTPGGSVAGTILWELKRTRNWSEGWLAKLRGDQRSINADIALMVSHALPKDCHTFDLKDGVWITGPQCVLPLVIALREQLLCVASAKQSSEGQHTKMERMYDYLTGTQFRHRVQAIVEQFTAMEEDLRRERRAIEKMWAKRDQQILGAVRATAGMWGDLQGIAGQSIPEVEGLDINLLTGPGETDSEIKETE